MSDAVARHARSGSRAPGRGGPHPVPVCLFLFLTGVSGLIYQVAWQRYIGRLVGCDSVATAIILGTFLGGLSVGFLICGHLTTRVKNRFRSYALLEAVIGIWGLSFPFIFGLVDSVTDGWSFSPPVWLVLQGTVSAVLLTGIPTVCMGATIPFLTRGLSGSLAESPRVHARIYGINTAGASAGALLAGFYLIPEAGLPQTVRIAAVFNLAAFVFFYLCAPPSDDTETASASPKIENRESSSASSAMLCAIVFVSGFYVMTLENVFIRIVRLSFGSSSHSFSLVVSIFILFIAVGGFLVGQLETYGKKLLYFNLMGIAVSSVAVYATLDVWPYLAHLARIVFQPNIAGMAGYHLLTFLGLSLILMVPVTLMGATVPIVFNLIKRDLSRVGRHSGLLFSFNTLGNLAGSLMGGIFFFWFWDNATVFLMAVLLAGIASFLAALDMGRKQMAASVAAVACVLVIMTVRPWYDSGNFVIGTFRIRSPLPYTFDGPRAFFDQYTKMTDLRFYADGPVATVAVAGTKPLSSAMANHPTFSDTERLGIFINGKSDSSTADLPTTKLLAHLPALFSETRQTALVVGLGTGVTAGELSLYPDIEQIDVSEISPSVVEALPHFKTITHNVHENEKMRIHLGDAFRVIKKSRKKWDIIASAPSNPWVTGTDSLFSAEFFDIVDAHLAERGIFAQWFQIYSASPEMVGMVMNTLTRRFPRVRVFLTGNADLLAVCSRQDVSQERIAGAEKILRENPGIRNSLAKIGIRSLDSILIREVWSATYAAEEFGGFGVNTLDHPVLHHLAGRDFFLGSSVPPEFLFTPKTAFHAENYLLAKKYADWSDPGFPGKVSEAIAVSVKDEKGLRPVLSALALKAHLSDPETWPMDEMTKNIFGVRLIPAISVGENPMAGPDDGNAGFRQRAEILLGAVPRSRSWINPYPLDGLKRLLAAGADRGRDAHEKNWCVLQLARILLNENAGPDRVKSVMNRAVRGNRGEMIIRPEDFRLLKEIQSRQ